MARKYPEWVPDPAGEPENPGRPLYCLPEYSPRVWIGRRMCVTHTCGLAGAAGGGTPQKFGACRHVQRSPAPRVGSVAWSIRPGCIPGVPKIPRGGAAMGKSAMPGVPGRFGTPHTLWPGVPPTAEPEPWRPKRRPAGQIHRNWGGLSAGISTGQVRSIFGALQGYF